MRALVLAITLVVLGSPAGADEADNRTELIARIADAVHAISTALDAHKLDDASAHAHDVHEMITRLVALKGNDSRAADIVAHYTAYADTTEAAIKRLGELGQKLHRTDGIVARCAKDDAALHKLLKRHTSHPNADPARDVDALATKADAYAATWSPVLTELATVDHAITGDVEATKLALTDGYWMAVSTSIAAEAKAAADLWADHYQAVTAACAPLGLGQHHAELAPVLEALRSRIATDHTTATQLVHDYNAWLASVRTLRELALQGRKALRDAICQATDGEIASRVGTVATNWTRDLDTTAATAAANRLRTDKHAPRAITDGLRVTGAIVASIARDEGQGRSNPRLVTALAAITKRRERSLTGCAATAVELDCAGSACRASCVKITDHVCTVVEPVPDQEGAKAAGFTRAQRALDALAAWYVRDKAGLFARVPALKRCEIAARATLDLSTDVVSYATCSAVTEAELGEPLGEVAPDVAAE
ncbi:MAG: hypothetical protein ABI591_33600 [Kofleriaceae bacterium]